MDPAKTNDANLKLIAAARWGSETQVEEALKSKFVNENYKEKTGYGYTPLHSAVQSNTRVAWVLIQDPGVRVNAKTNLGHTPLHFGWPQCVDAMLLSGKRVLWNVKDNIGQTPLLYHARLLNEECLRALLGVKFVNMDSKTQDRFTVLHQVVERDTPFPIWFKKEKYSPELCCKVVGLLLDELKRRAPEKKKREDKLKRRASEKKKTEATPTEATEATPTEATEATPTEATEATPTEATEATEATPTEPTEPTEQTLTRSCGQFLARFKRRAKKDTNTQKPAEDEENEIPHRVESEGKGNQGSPEETGTSNLSSDAKTKELGQQSKQAQPAQPNEPSDPVQPEAGLQSVVVEFVNIRDKIGRTALHYIAEHGCIEILDKLLKWFTVQHVRSEVRVNDLDFYGFAPLHLAVLKGHTQMVERLLKETHENVPVGAPSTVKPKLMEWNEKHVELCRPNLFSKKPERKNSIEGFTALRLAAMGGHTEIADLLLNWKRSEEGGDQTPVDVAGKDQGELKLSFATGIDYGHLEVATLLLRHITEKKQLDDAFEKMLVLAMGKQHQRVSEVFEKSKQVDGFTNIFERLLIVAAQVNLPDVIRNIFNWKLEVDVNVETKWKDARNSSNLRATPLHFAVLRGHVDIVRQLLSHKSLDVNAEDSYHRTPLQIAVEGDRSRHAKDGGKLSDGDKIKRKQIEKLLMERAEVKDLVERLYRDREVFINAVNALLVGAALIATVTFAGWLTPPLGLTAYVPPEPSPASPATSPHYLSLPQPTSVKVFWVSNSLSFFLAIATVLVCACAAMPSLRYIGEAVKCLKKTLIVASTLFLLSVFFVLGAFASAGFAVLPSPHRAYKLSMKSTVAIGGVLCGFCLIVLIWQLLRQSCEDFHGDKTSSTTQQESKPSINAPQQQRPNKANTETHDDCATPVKCSPKKLLEDNSSQGGTQEVVNKDNAHLEKVSSMVISKWKNIARKRKVDDSKADNELEFGQEKVMINLNDIQCAFERRDVTDNIVNIFIHCILKGVQEDTWIAPPQLINKLLTIGEDNWSKEMEEIKKWETCQVAKKKPHHIFPFSYTGLHEQLRQGQPPQGQGAGFSGHWSLICREPKQFVHLDSLKSSHKEENVAPFLKKVELSLMEVSNDNDKATIDALQWEPLPVPQQQGSSMDCGYYMMLNLEKYLKAREEGRDTNLDGSKWFTVEDANSLRDEICKKIEDMVMAE
ncbi:unnamed protein product [Sphagnum jensenii]|uniref:Ubiquitin-like protease family profile domain-containing protein n=1 Tax=Sphagnum jensenii TaxID=128206 RepID=A0ABP0WIL1_9BRYO